MINSQRVHLTKDPMFYFILSIVLLILAGLVGGCSEDPTLITLAESVDAGEKTLVQPHPINTLIHCQGLKCSQPGDVKIPGFLDRKYSYIVTPGRQGVSRIRIGLHQHIGFNPTNVVLPTNWTWTIVQGVPSPDRLNFVGHGQVTSPVGTCNDVILFSGPTMNNQFQIGFNATQNAHEVDWQTGGIGANWNKPIGMGAGPIHGPLGFVNPGGDQVYEGPGDVVK